MFTAYVVVSLMAIAANTFAATGDFRRYKFVLINAAKASVPESWLPMLGTLKAAGALGLLVGLTDEKILDLEHYATSPHYTDLERLALEYADSMTITGRDVSDDLFARLRQAFGDDALVELTGVI